MLWLTISLLLCCPFQLFLVFRLHLNTENSKGKKEDILMGKPVEEHFHTMCLTANNSLSSVKMSRTVATNSLASLPKQS